MSFETEVPNKVFKQNFIFEIDGVYYGTYQPDSGLTLDADKVGVVMKKSINSSVVDIRNVRTAIASINFQLLDKGGALSVEIAGSDDQMMERDVKLWVGRITGSEDFSGYKLIGRGNIKSITKDFNSFRFVAQEATNRIDQELVIETSTLDGDILAADTTLTLLDATDFPTSGIVKIGDEFIAYTGKSANDLTGLVRGNLSSTAEDHDDEDEVFLVKELQGNPLDIFLQLCISPGGGGTYDVLDYGLGLDESLFDIATFEDIRDNKLDPTDEFLFYLYEIESLLKFLEDEVLLATATRIITKEGLISIARLGQIDLTLTPEEIDESSIISNPTWRLDSKKIVNKIKINYNWSEGLNDYTRVYEAQDDDSITNYGEKNTLELNFKGVQVALNGTAIVTDRASRLLARLSTARGEISATTHFDKALINVGDQVRITHRYLPGQGGGLGLSDQLEVLGAAYLLDNATMRFTLQYTEYAGLRVGLIAPSPLIVSVTSQSIFTVPDSTCYRAGDVLKLWNDSTMSYYADAANTILSIDNATNTITMSSPWSTTLTTSVRIKLADYDLAGTYSKSQFAFIVPDTNEFVSDGSKGYQIVS